MPVEKPTRRTALETLAPVPHDEIFALNRAYTQDGHPQKVNLTMGVYRTDDGKPWPLRSVRKAEKQLLDEGDISRHEYSAIEGDLEFVGLARDLMFGFPSAAAAGKVDDSAPQTEAQKRIASVQTVAGTGANHVGAVFLARHMKPRHVWLSNPSWANHMALWDMVGVARKTYPYYNAATQFFDFDGMMATLETDAQAGDVVLLHACAHNPTGLDPTQEQWMAIADLCERKRLFPFFDIAYQGFASGSVEKDAWAVRYFFTSKPRMEMCVAQSFSKNFGLYGQRVGAFHYVTRADATELKDLVVNNLCHIIRGEFSMAPRAGCSIVKKILTDSDLTAEWHDDLRIMSSRIRRMRLALHNELGRLQTPGTWEHIVTQNGMFSYTGLTPKQVYALKDKYHIYLLKSGRASISGLSEGNVAYVAQAIDDVVRNVN